MKIKREPKKPVRKTDIKDAFGDVDLDGQPVDGLEDYIRNHVKNLYANFFKMSGLTIDDYKEFRLEEEYPSYSDYKTIEVYGIREETDMEFAKRMDAYEKRLVAWGQWYTENEQAIKDEEQRREDQLKAELAEKQAKEIVQLERKLKRLKNAKS